MATVEKKVRAITTSVSGTGLDAVLTWTPIDGAPLSIRVGDVTEKNREYAPIHGLLAKIGDCSALGKGATVAQKMAAMRVMVEHLTTSDSWNMGRTLTPSLGEFNTVVLQAVANVQKTTVDVIKANLEARAEKTGVKFTTLVKTLSTAAAVVVEISKILEASGTGIDADEMLADMLGE